MTLALVLWLLGGFQGGDGLSLTQLLSWWLFSRVDVRCHWWRVDWLAEVRAEVRAVREKVKQRTKVVIRSKK